MEALQLYGTNAVSFQLASGVQQWHIVRWYLVPYNSSTIEDVVAAIRHCPWEGALLVVVDYNTDLVAPEGGEQDEDIVAAMAEAGLEYSIRHFLLHHKPWFRDDRMWCMRRGVHEVRSWTDYILGKDCSLHQNVAVRYAQHNTYH